MVGKIHKKTVIPKEAVNATILLSVYLLRKGELGAESKALLEMTQALAPRIPESKSFQEIMDYSLKELEANVPADIVKRAAEVNEVD